MTEETSKKTNFFKDVLKSIKDLDKYEDYAIELPKTAFKYLFKLVLLLCVIICIFYSYKIVKNLNSIYNNFINIIPEFSYNEGILDVNSENAIVFEDYKDVIGKIVIDTKGTLEEYEEEKDIGILLLKDKIIVLSNNAMGQVIYSYEDIAKGYGITEFTKEDVINYVEGMNIISLYGSELKPTVLSLQPQGFSLVFLVRQLY